MAALTPGTTVAVAPDMEPEQKHPIGMYTLSITALFQNFCFWGVVSFFPLYLTGEHQYSESDATEAYGIFLGIATALPLLGGYVSSYLKRYSIAILPPTTDIQVPALP